MALKERGWTDALVKRFLGEPDKIQPRSRWSILAPYRLYALARIEQAEQTQNWVTAREQAAIRSASARQRAQNKTDELIATVNAIAVKVPSLPKDVLLKQAIVHYNYRQQYVDSEVWHPPADIDSDLSFLQRIQVNYLRHECTVYDDALDSVRRRIGADQARALIRNRILQRIAEVYPDLANECQYQQR